MRSGRAARRLLATLSTLMLTAGLTSCGGAEPEPSPSGVSGSWQLALHDEFDGEVLDEEIWTPLRGLEPETYPNPYNPELDGHAYDPSRVKVEDGNLVLSWDPTPLTVPGREERPPTTYPYTAGVAHTGRAEPFTHGFVEARIFIPDEPGLWPAFWLLPVPVDEQWPPEIDIMEMIPDDTPDGLYHPHFNYHWQGPNSEPIQVGWRWYGEEGTSYAGSWHTYGLLLQEEYLQDFLDGEPGPVYEGPTIVDTPMYVIFSTGAREGAAPPAGAMLVDYLRVWTPA